MKSTASKADKMMRIVTKEIDGATMIPSAIVETAANLRVRAAAEFLAGDIDASETLQLKATCYERCAMQCAA